MNSNSKNYEAVIGLEVHAQLSTKSKLFCSCAASFGAAPNSQTCPVCLGHPGALPSPNKKAIEFTVLAGLATNCKINPFSEFARKNYFYPDLPKGYQITQSDYPICENGYLTIRDENKHQKKIGLERIHLEEDAGKLIHTENSTLIDYNRCGIPLIEIVSRPEISTPEEAQLYLLKLKQLLSYLNISDCNMEEGSLRCDANISVREAGLSDYGTRTEIKNLNSFNNVKQALAFEIDRHISILQNGNVVSQQTLTWDPESKQTQLLREKEGSEDYRYFPEPDLRPVKISDKWLTEIKSQLVELPDQKSKRFSELYQLSDYDINLLTSETKLADYFEELVHLTGEPKNSANWILGEVLHLLNENNISISDFNLTPQRLAGLIKLFSTGEINQAAAKTIFNKMVDDPRPAESILKELGLAQISDQNMLEKIIDKIITEYPDQVKQYQNGKINIIGFFMGKVMQATSARANPELTKSILTEKLKD